jgi:hypothetical protein
VGAKREKGGAEKVRDKKAIADSRDSGRWAKVFGRAGEPDLENPETDLAYTRKLQLLVLHQMATTPKPTLRQQECWKRIREMSAVVGMTSSRAALEAKVRKLTKMLADRNVPGTVTEVAGSSVAKPPTARGGPRGPQRLPDDPTLPTE